MALKNFFHHITFLTAWDRVNNSTLVLNVVTVFYLVKRQLINPLNNLNRYPFILCLVAGLSVKAASLTQATTN
jgi:hypothetical protein